MYPIHHCPVLLKEGYDTYSPTALRQLFYGKQVTPYLDFATEDEEDFRRFGLLIGLSSKRVEAVLKPFMIISEEVKTLIERSFLSENKLKRAYWRVVEERHQRFVREE